MIKKRFEVWCDSCNKYLMKADLWSIEQFENYLIYRGWFINDGKHICEKCKEKHHGNL